MPEWVYLLHPPRDNFAATMTEEEAAAFKGHFEWLDRLLEKGLLPQWVQRRRWNHQPPDAQLDAAGAARRYCAGSIGISCGIDHPFPIVSLLARWRSEFNVVAGDEKRAPAIAVADGHQSTNGPL
jgi:hypothetical protein